MSALAGKRVVVTRAPHQAADLAALLESRGAVPLLYPCIDIAPPNDTAALDSALRGLADGEYDWLVLTSANTVEALARRAAALHVRLDFLGLHVAAVGTSTAQAARKALGLRVDAIPETFTAAALPGAMGSVRGLRVLLPQSAIAERALADSLIQAGADVTVVEAYRTVVGTGGEDVPDRLIRGEIDALTFTSSSSAMNFAYRVTCEDSDVAHALGICAACIGPSTAATAEELGFEIIIMPDEHTLNGLVIALETYFSLK